MERLTSGRLESQRLLEPLLIELSPDGAPGAAAHARAISSVWGSSSRISAATRCDVTAVPALLGARRGDAAVRALARGPRRPRSRRARRGRAQADRRDHGVPCSGEGELSADHEKMVHILEELRAHGVFDHLPARPAGDAALTRREIEKNFQRI